MPLFEIGQILLATLCGLAIGLERQVHGSQAGLRTYSLVCLGSCLFGLVSTHSKGLAYYESVADPTRIAAQIVSGIGFLGAGVIFKDRSRVHGLTTAANIWVTASIGLAVAFEMIIIPLITTALVIVILSCNRWKIFIKFNKMFNLEPYQDRDDAKKSDDV
jgi:putative Mg2+ transporter-C (MgtC) family protein